MSPRRILMQVAKQVALPSSRCSSWSSRSCRCSCFEAHVPTGCLDENAGRRLLLFLTVTPLCGFHSADPGRPRPERRNLLSRFGKAIYLQVLRFRPHGRKLAIALNLLFLLVTLPLALRLGSQSLPPLSGSQSI